MRDEAVGRPRKAKNPFQFDLSRPQRAQDYYVRSNDLHSIGCTREAEDWWIREVIAHRGKTDRNRDCTPGYYNFEGEFNRRQDGNYNGSFRRFVDHMTRVRGEVAEHFALTERPD